MAARPRECGRCTGSVPSGHNTFPIARRQYHSRLFIADTIEPDSLYGLLDGLELHRTVVNVMSAPGAPAETWPNSCFMYNLLQGRLGAAKVRERVVVTADPEDGLWRRLAELEGLQTLSRPAKVGGGFGVFSPVGSLPGAMVGIDIEELLAGARFMDQHLQAAR